ncbi:Glu/Leu/Phe/Val dehydrogenase [Candidatus Riflebacteria bacterium]
MENKKLLKLSLNEFVNFLKKEKIFRFYFVYNPEIRVVISSHPHLQEIADFLNHDKRDFMEHEGLFFQVSRRYSVLQGAFVHRTNRGQAAGGVRFWQYNTLEDYLRDGLRLAKGMTRKNALAGLWWGGGKGVMAHDPALDKNDLAIREAIYSEYGELMTSLRGCYVTAEDVGTNVTDMANVFSRTRFTTCIPEELGGSGNPSVPTARGVISGIEAALEFIGAGDLNGKSVAIQGLGNVGLPLLEFLLEKKVAKIIGSDIDRALVEKINIEFQGENVEAFFVERDDCSFMGTDCDIFAPCATGGILNPDSIPKLKAKIICGAANNQLQDSLRDDASLFAKGIVYVPDFLTNRMGIVNCADEQAGYVINDDYFERHLNRDWQYSIHQTTLRVLQKSKDTNEPPAKVATKIADELSLQDNPIFGHRGKKIIDSLIAEHWEKGEVLFEE